MTPVMFELPTGDLVVGSPGGQRITTLVFLGILNFLENGNPMQMVLAPRFHWDLASDSLEYELDAFNAKELLQLRNAGYKLTPMNRTYGNLQVLFQDKNQKISGASDPRHEGKLAID